MNRSVVLAGGGVSGIAWLLGVVTSLREAGVDLADAESVIGTSAGSVVATQLATGTVDAAAHAQLQVETAERSVAFDTTEFVALVEQAVARSSSPQDAARRLAQLPLQQNDVGPEERRAIVAARLPVHDWPTRNLQVCAVVRDTGERVVFSRPDGVPLVDAVTASCAVPGVWPAVPIGGRDHVDGGAYSMTNADLARGADRTLVLVPVVPSAQQLATLDAELGPDASLVLAADDASGAAFGPNPLDPARRADAFRAGRRQGAAAAARVTAFWAGG